jgi:hypothetical protein
MLHDSTSGERLAATPGEVGGVADAWRSGVAPVALNLGRSRKIDHVGQGRLLAVAGRPRLGLGAHAPMTVIGGAHPR